MVNTHILWQGNLPLTNIKWELNNTEFNIDSENENDRKKGWLQYLKEDPNAYDGDLLYLEEFNISDENLILNVQKIKFSSLITQKNLHKRFNLGNGILGIQCMIFSPKKDYFLLGIRNYSNNYCPGFKTVPGGMVEYKDTLKDPEVSLLREVNEEVAVAYGDVHLRAILQEHNYLSVILLLETNIIENFDTFNPNEIVRGYDNEWEGSLRWIPISKLVNFDTNTILEGLTYYKENYSSLF